MMWVLVIGIGILLVLALLALAAGLRASARYRRACRYVRGLFSELDEPLPADIGAMDLEGLLKTGYERIVAQLVRPSNDQIMKFKTLQNQVNPHFLYNTLESIRAVALCDGEKGLPQIAAMTEALARYFRYNISNRNDMVSLDEEMNNIEQYMMIQRFRFSDRFELQILYQNCDASVRGFMLPKLLLQPIVENAIFHGLEGKTEKGLITITVTETEGKILISIEDNGIGMDDETLFELQKRIHQKEVILKDDEDAHNGVALWQINQQIQTLFGEDFGMHIYSTEGVGTVVELVLPKIVG